MNPRLVRNFLLVGGSILLGIGILLGLLFLAGPIVYQGINDGEWGRISHTGRFSAHEELQWTDWQENDGSITPFSGFQPEVEKPKFAQFRRGDVHGFLFNFTVYEGRGVNSESNATFPALGPHWGASYNSIWAIPAIALGIAGIFASRYVRPAHSPPHLPNPTAETT
ncbi:hypothetical protein [Roseimicrobium sp. ORNL1]|uniref:hypothetical protein n=1 Tax=Roseimicrobium sp. ORNL1 TaxID=2711231 RepID=UPI0013E1C5C0|nr:hypothetical protein [Roseimicrobium sp. ORNL1]QIF00813.1 hypothetical protein G5S37_04490 [Roseimicrobium sp. ORNL1]